MDKADQNLYDAPIGTSVDDRLGRKPFAHLIAGALLSTAPTGASVIGLVGPYGTGKSSVAVMVEEIIGNQASVVRFEPWMVGTREALAEEFFIVLGRAVVPADGGEISETTRKKFYRYGSKVMKAVSIGASAVGVIVPGVEVAGKAANSAAEALELAAAGLEARATQPTLVEFRQQLVGELSGLTQLVVVIVDDVDRLTRDELRTLLQLIKACADLPKVRYLLLYDREQVLHALEGFVNDPDAFLEKIVNQPFDLPEATASQRADLLEEYLEGLDLEKDLPKHAQDRLAMVFDRLLLPGLGSVRRIKRFVSTVSSLLPGVVCDGFRNVDPADFLALEYLRQNSPTVYHALRNEEAPNPGGRVSRLVNHKEWPKLVAEKRKTALDALQWHDKELAKVATDLLLETPNTLSISDRRFNTAFWKPVYFGFDEARAGVSEGKWQAFIKSLAQSNEEQPWLKDWANPQLRSNWTTSIVARALEIPWQESKNLLVLLLEWGDAQKPESSEPPFSHLTISDHVCTCVTAILKSTPEGLNPVAVMAEAVTASGSLVTAGFCVGWEAGQLKHNQYEAWSHGYDLKPLLTSLRRLFRRFLSANTIWGFGNVDAARSTVYYLLGEKAHAIWWSSVAADPEQVIKYIERDLAYKDLSNTVIDEGPLLDAIQNLDPNILSVRGRIARKDILRSSKSRLTKRNLSRRPEIDE